MVEIKKIICAVDLSEHSVLVAEYAATFARGCNAKVIAVYAAPELTQYVGVNVPTTTIENFVAEIVAGAEKSMQEFVDKNFPGIDAVGKVVHGYAAEEILAVAESVKADMIVMGTHGRKGVQRLLFGSVAEKVVRTSTIPVLTVRPS